MKEKNSVAIVNTGSIVPNRIFALVWRILLVCCSLVGIPCIFMCSSGYYPESQLFYFTMQTNFFVLFMFLYLVVKSIMQIVKEGTKGEVAHINPSLELFVTYGITITFLGYAVLLSSIGFTMNMGAQKEIYEAGNWLVHIIVPFMAIADFVMFMPHGNVSYKQVGLWMIYPFIYLIMLIIRAAAQGTDVFVIGTKVVDGNVKVIKSLYPYFFIAFEKFPVWQSVLIVLALVVFFVLFGMLYVLIDKKLAKFNKPTNVTK